MLFRKHIVSTRTLLQLTVAVLFLVAAVGVAVAAAATNSGNPPSLTPYTNWTVAGTSQLDNAAGTGYVATFKGDGGPAVPYALSGIGTTNAVMGAGTVLSVLGTPAVALSGPGAIGVDSVGNVYIADTGNNVIREVNYATGIINTIAGLPPVCSGTTCVAQKGCADGVPANEGKIGSGIIGITVDSFENVYFTDTASDSASIIYRGGKRVADFIALVNPAGIARSGGSAQVGYLYHIGGEINLQTCVGTTANLAGTTIDNAPAFEDISVAGAPLYGGATMHADQTISLDSAGNIYIDDNGSVRVINTQETPQTFFEYTVQPGYMRYIVNCALVDTPACPAIESLVVGTGTNGPANGAVFSNNDGVGTADQYGNVYQMESRQGLAAYAGGAPLTSLLTAETPYLASTFSATESSFAVPTADAPTPNELPLAYGNTYVQIGDPAITSALPAGYLAVIVVTNQRYASDRTGLWVDSFGTMYYQDNHFGNISRIDQFTADGTFLTGAWAGTDRLSKGTGPGGLKTVTNSNGTATNYSTYATFANPWDCVWGTSAQPWTTGPQTYSPLGDGCPGLLSDDASGQNANWGLASDSFNNLYYGDQSQDLIRVMKVGSQFPTLPVTSTIQPWSATTTYGLYNLNTQTIPCTLACEVSYQGATYLSLAAGNIGNTPGPSITSKWSIVGPVTQPIQVHFDVSNIPVTNGVTVGSFTSMPVTADTFTAYTTNAFSIPAGEDFSIDTTTPEFPMGAVYTFGANAFAENATTNLVLYPTAGNTGAPTCAQLGAAAPDLSWDCLVYVKFNPTQPGLRQGQLQVTTANGSQYTFLLTGTGTGGQLAIDGGQPALVATTGLSSATAVAVDPLGTVYVADPANNRIVVKPATGSQTAITTFTLTSLIFNAPSTANASLKGPKGVAVDGAGNVYISDTGNNRVLKYNPELNTATLLGSYTWVPGAACDGGASTTLAAPNCKYAGFLPPGTAAGTPVPTSILTDVGASVTATVAPPQYAFNAPQGLAVDAWGNVYVADTGNAVVVEIPADTWLGGATPLLQYPGAPTFTTPVGVAVDSNGFIYVADTGNAAGQIVRIPPGGGDLQPAGTAGSALTVVSVLPPFDGQSVTTANGVAVDAAGDVYVSDSGTNTVVEAPATLGSNGTPFALSFSVPNSAITPTGLSTPAGLALDANGNLYVADSGNNRVLVMNRLNPAVPFGTVPQSLTYPTGVPGSGVAGTPVGCPATGSSTPCTGVLTVTNIGNQPVSITPSTFLSAVNPPFTVTTTCANPILAGTTCTISPYYKPTSDGAATQSVTVNGSQSIAMMGGTGANPEASVVLTTPTMAPAANSTPVITATITQPHVTAAPTPSGTVVFTAVLDANTADAGLCGAPIVSSPQTVNGSGVATWTMPAVVAGITYTVSAVFTPGSSDTTDSITNATPILLTVAAATAETVTATSVSYTYAQPVPAVTGTVTPALPSGVSLSFIGTQVLGGVTYTASQFSPPGSYAISAVFSGTGSAQTAACGLGSPFVATTPGGGTQSTITESAAPLTIAVGAYTTVYGAQPPVNYLPGLTITGAFSGVVNGVAHNDAKELSATFAPVNSSVLSVGTQPVTATVIGKPISVGDYSIKSNTAGTITVTAAPTGIGVTAVNQTGAVSALGLGAATYVANTATAIAAATFPIQVNTLVSAGLGTPTGTVTVYDTFVPITTTAFVPTTTSDAIPLACSTTVLINCVPSGVPIITACAANAAASASCTPQKVLTLTAASATFVIPPYVPGTPSPYYTSTGTIVPGTHYFAFAYSGDSNFSCSVSGPASSIPGGTTCAVTGTAPVVMIVDNPDFTLTTSSSAAGVLNVIAGNVPSGNGLPTLPNQNTSNPQSIVIEIGGVLNFAGQLNLSCTTQFSYESCFTGQVVVLNNTVTLINTVSLPLILSTGASSETAPFVFDVSMPASLPLGYNTTTAQLGTAASRMALAILPLGLLAFCVRRRRRLSKLLWMLIAIAAVSAGMSGCSSPNVAFYSPIPFGPQNVTVNASYGGNGTTLPAVTRSYVVSIDVISTTAD